ALLITRSEEGMTLYRQGERLHVPAVAREVYDVSGAGDTVIAVLGVMLAAGAGFADAVSFANKSAGIVVGKLGTAVVHPEELFHLSAKMYIVVTCAAGFIGSNLVKALNARGETNILAVDNLSRAEKFRNLVDCEIADYLDKEHFRAALDAGSF